jgi:CheY-like chemotaxis protein
MTPPGKGASCPRCGAAVQPSSADEELVCPNCHARLKAASPRAGDDRVLAELRAVRVAQQQLDGMLREVLSILKAPPSLTAASPIVFPPVAPPSQQTRSRDRLVVVIDDDAANLSDAQAALVGAGTAVHVFSDGHLALPSIAAHRPDVIVVDPDIAAPMPGGDIINMIRSTLEWVNIPLVLYSRRASMTADEARAQGGDDLVLKTNGAQALVERVRFLFNES